MSDYESFIKRAQKQVLNYFRRCPFCGAGDSMRFEWGFNKDTMACTSCGAQWHINHGLGGFNWAKLIKADSAEKGIGLLGRIREPEFWQRMTLGQTEFTDETPPNEQARDAETEEPERLGRSLLKYFAHGILFSVLFIALAFLWAVILVGLVLFGAIIGLIIGLLVLFLLVGGLNAFLMDLIWGIRVKGKWTSLIAHGFVLFILLLIVSIPSIIIVLIIPSGVTYIAAFVAYAFVDGFVAKQVGRYWEEEYEESD